jgi:hypothetical protein
VFVCDRHPLPPPTQERERNKHFGLREREVFRVGQHCRRVRETFRVVSFSPPAILAAGSWRKGTRGGGRNGRTRGARDRAPALCRLQPAACFCAPQRSRAGNLFGSVLDAERRWRGAVREGAGQSGCVRSVRVRLVSPGASVDDNRYPLSARGAISHLSRGAREIKNN